MNKEKSIVLKTQFPKSVITRVQYEYMYQSFLSNRMLTVLYCKAACLQCWLLCLPTDSCDYASG